MFHLSPKQLQQKILQTIIKKKLQNDLKTTQSNAEALNQTLKRNKRKFYDFY